jgi:hypothetical protein
MTIHTEIGIGAPAPAVWAILTDTAKWPEWNPFMTLKAGRLVVGERLVVEIRPPGKPAATFKPTVTKLEPGRELRWLGHLGVPGIFDGEHGFRVAAEDVGRCHLEQFETFGGILSRPVLWYVGAASKAGFEAMNRALKARAEAR